MKILLSNYAIRYPLSGIGWYAHHLLAGLTTHSAIQQIACVPRRLISPQKNFISSRCWHFSKKIIRNFPGIYSSLNSYHNYKFKKKIDKYIARNFIYHEPSYILKPYSGPKVCTIHDLSHINCPDSHPKQRVKYLLRYLPHSVKEADHIITGSHFTRQEIIDYYQVSPKKITTIYHGVSPDFKLRSRLSIRSILEKYNLWKKSYLLSVATLEPRKNLAALILAFSRLPAKQRKCNSLVLIGVKERRFPSTLEKLIIQLKKRGELYILGYIPAVELPLIYSGAYAFVYLSLYEGFGLPVLEAMSSGLPTLVANTSSIPEVAGEGALLVDPYSEKAIHYGLEQLLTDEVLRNQLKQRCLLQAKRFSWQQCIESTVAVYQQVSISCS